MFMIMLLHLVFSLSCLPPFVLIYTYLFFYFLCKYHSFDTQYPIYFCAGLSNNHSIFPMFTSFVLFSLYLLLLFSFTGKTCCPGICDSRRCMRIKRKLF